MTANEQARIECAVPNYLQHAMVIISEMGSGRIRHVQAPEAAMENQLVLNANKLRRGRSQTRTADLLLVRTAIYILFRSFYTFHSFT
jgi:hypothetical protein